MLIVFSRYLIVIAHNAIILFGIHISAQLFSVSNYSRMYIHVYNIWDKTSSWEGHGILLDIHLDIPALQWEHKELIKSTKSSKTWLPNIYLHLYSISKKKKQFKLVFHWHLYTPILYLYKGFIYSSQFCRVKSLKSDFWWSSLAI